MAIETPGNHRPAPPPACRIVLEYRPDTGGNVSLVEAAGFPPAIAVNLCELLKAHYVGMQMAQAAQQVMQDAARKVTAARPGDVPPGPFGR